MLSTLITMDRPGGHRRVRRDFYIGTNVREKLFGWQNTVTHAFVEEFQDFVGLAEGRNGNAVIARGEDGLRIAQIVEAVYRSAQTGESIPLDPPANASGE
jgi:predicted dehydrogenase